MPPGHSSVGPIRNCRPNCHLPITAPRRPRASPDGRGTCPPLAAPSPPSLVASKPSCCLLPQGLGTAVPAAGGAFPGRTLLTSAASDEQRSSRPDRHRTAGTPRSSCCVTHDPCHCWSRVCGGGPRETSSCVSLPPPCASPSVHDGPPQRMLILNVPKLQQPRGRATCDLPLQLPLHPPPQDLRHSARPLQATSPSLLLSIPPSRPQFPFLGASWRTPAHPAKPQPSPASQLPWVTLVPVSCCPCAP